MATAYTSLLGLALPVTGELSGTWGDTVNDSITSLLDSAIAGTTTLSSDADVTLTTTTGASNTSRQAIILWTAGGTTTRNITAPAQSKIYTVINASSNTQSIVLRGVGPTTGVTIVKGEKALCAWNGSDFIKISNTAGAGSFTTLTSNGATTFTAGTASTSTTTGTLVVTGGLGVSGRVNAANFDGIVGANTAAAGSFTTLAASSTLGVTGVSTFAAGTAAAPAITTTGDTNTGIFFPAADTIAFTEGGVEAARIDSSGNLGIGTSSPASRLTTSGGTGTTNGLTIIDTDYSNDTHQIYGNNSLHLSAGTGGAGAILFRTGGSERARIDSSGNLLVGTTANVTGAKFNLAQGASNGVMYQLAQFTGGSGTGGNTVGGLKRQSTASVANSATTILSSMSFGELIVVTGTGSGAIFADLLMGSYNTIAVISSNTQQGSPASRTYSVSSGALQLTMGSATAMAVTAQSIVTGALGT